MSSPTSQSSKTRTDFGAITVGGYTVSNKLQFSDLTAAGALTAADSGKTFYLNSATEFDTTLPAVADATGFHARFVVKAAPSGASYTITSAANDIHGGMSTSDVDGTVADAANTAGTAVDVISFVDGAAVIGDYIDIRCDGTFYYVSGNTAVAAGVTLA